MQSGSCALSPRHRLLRSHIVVSKADDDHAVVLGQDCLVDVPSRRQVRLCTALALHQSAPDSCARAASAAMRRPQHTKNADMSTSGRERAARHTAQQRGPRQPGQARIDARATSGPTSRAARVDPLECLRGRDCALQEPLGRATARRLAARLCVSVGLQCRLPPSHRVARACLIGVEASAIMPERGARSLRCPASWARIDGRDRDRRLCCALHRLRQP